MSSSHPYKDSSNDLNIDRVLLESFSYRTPSERNKTKLNIKDSSSFHRKREKDYVISSTNSTISTVASSVSNSYSTKCSNSGSKSSFTLVSLDDVDCLHVGYAFCSEGSSDSSLSSEIVRKSIAQRDAIILERLLPNLDEKSVHQNECGDCFCECWVVPVPYHSVKSIRTKIQYCQSAFEEAVYTMKGIIQDKTIEDPQELSSLMEYSMEYLLQAREYDHAINVLDECVQMKLSLHDKTAIRMMRPALRNMGNIYLRRGKFHKALFFFKRALAVTSSINVRKNVWLLQSKIAVCFFAIGDYKQALRRFFRALQCRRKELESSSHHRNMYESKYSNCFNDLVSGKIMNNIACVFYHQNRFALALKSCDEARDSIINCGEVDKATALDIAMSACNTACTYVKMLNDSENDDNLIKAIALFEKALEYENTVLHYGHTLIVVTMENLAHVHQLNASYDEQLDIYFQILQIHERQHGEENINYVKTLGDISLAYIKLERYQEALSCLEKVLETQIQLLGPMHTEVSNTEKVIRKMRRYLNSTANRSSE